MTHLESLRRQLQYAVEKYGENAFVSLNLKRQIDEIEQSRLSGQAPQIQQFQAVPQGKRAQTAEGVGPPFQAFSQPP
jgi:hypothetical protein